MHRHQLSCALFHLSKFFPCPFQEWSWVSDKEGSQDEIRFLLQRLILRRFLALLRYSFFPVPIFPSTSDFHFLRAFWFFLWFDISISSVICLFLLLIICMTHFCMQNSIPISWQCFVIVCFWVSSYFSFFANNMIPSIWLSFLLSFTH